VTTPQLHVYAAHAQSLALKAMARLPQPPASIPLWLPRCRLATGGASVANLYDECFCQGLYESPKPLPPAPRIVDAGGHLGMASLYFLSRYPLCRLTTLEPNPALAALLRRNLAPWASQASVLEAALSTRAGTVQFHVTRDNPLNVTGGIDNREADGCEISTFEVPCLDARNVLSEPVDLMKLDVEGHEYELLRLEQFNPAHIRNLVIEFHDLDRRAAEFAEVMQLLVDERGYRVANQDAVQMTPADLSALPDCVVLKLY
jgi:FkbM family methyltransferase